MKDLQTLIDSGILELYVLGQTTEQENLHIEQMKATHPQIQQEIDQISLALEKYALEHAVKPDPIIKPFLLATIDYTDRVKSGELITPAPLLDEISTESNYRYWISRKDMIPPHYFEDVFAKIISYTAQAITAIVWLKHMAPQEVHDNEFERFLILEGSCNIHIENEIHSLTPGSYLEIPLHKRHHVIVTSQQPCKVLLQRIAA
ncbi:cupin domain-containing protein [Pedobacter heparinus]|uniref:cupin domain-containing protein n=1 Tax=Pedobacter heparinus TaxID=984 RepID=UPI00292FEEBE|nr:cupin domain-containing protein [Pedobacter heparinus]